MYSFHFMYLNLYPKLSEGCYSWSGPFLGIFTYIFIIGIKHGFSCINIRQVPWEVLKTEAEGSEC